MGALFEFTGVVKKVNEIQRFESGFEKQEIVLTDDIGVEVRYPNILCFVFKKERVSLIQGIHEGQRVKIVFAIDGREWTDNYGKVRYFTDLTGIKIDVLAGGEKSEEKKPPEETHETVSADADDIPF